MQPKNPWCLLQLQKSVSFGCLIAIAVSSLFLTKVQSHEYLKEAPSFLTPCTLSDPKNGVCLAKTIENLYTNWRDGIPGLKNLGSIDPFHVKKVRIVQKNENIDLKLELKNITITGLTKTKVIKASVDNEYNFKLLLSVPSMKSKGNYRMKGTLLLLSVDSTGSMETELSDVEILANIKTNLVKAESLSFFDITSVRTTVKSIGNFHSQYSNLFNGNTELGESANAVFNQNWRELFELMRPAVEETMDAISLDRYKKIFNYVPANYFFIDLP